MLTTTSSAKLLSKYRNRQLEFLPAIQPIQPRQESSGPQYNQARSPIAPTLTWNRALFPKSAKALDDARRAKEEQGRKNQEASGEHLLTAEEGKKLAETYQEADRSGRIELLMGVTNLLAERRSAAKDLGVL